MTIEKSCLQLPCPKCWIVEKKRCLDLRTKEGPTRYNKHPHKERVRDYVEATS